MSLLRRLFNRHYRRARAAEGAGDYRRAAALYVEADMPEAAASALLFHAARSEGLDDRLCAYEDALRWLPEDHERHREVQIQMGLAILEDAQRNGARTGEERRRLADAATRLEQHGRPSDAATAYELLSRPDDMARCLEDAGEIERLERVLEQMSSREEKNRRLHRLVSDYEMAMKMGARLEARDALRGAIHVAPQDGSLGDLLRRLEDRIPVAHRVELNVDGRRVAFVGRLPATLGRSAADIQVRGASVSRRHAEIQLRGSELWLRDLDSRNGTLLGRVPIAGEIALTGETTVGLGDDVSVTILPKGPAAVLTVDRGLDQGSRTVIGAAALPVPDVPATVSFTGGHAVLSAADGATLTLAGQRCALPIILLRDDHIRLDQHEIEVLG